MDHQLGQDRGKHSAPTAAREGGGVVAGGGFYFDEIIEETLMDRTEEREMRKETLVERGGDDRLGFKGAGKFLEMRNRQ